MTRDEVIAEAERIAGLLEDKDLWDFVEFDETAKAIRDLLAHLTADAQTETGPDPKPGRPD